MKNSDILYIYFMLGKRGVTYFIKKSRHSFSEDEKSELL